MKTAWLIALIVAGSVLVGAGRFMVPGHGLTPAGTYEALAHIWVGVLIVLCFWRPTRRTAVWTLALLTVLETVMFLLR